MRGVQRVDEVWREGVLLFHRVGSPAEGEGWDRSASQTWLCSDGSVTNHAADLAVFSDWRGA